MYVHKRCVQSDWEIEEDKVGFGLCVVCGNQGTIYHVKGSPNEYQFLKGGTRYWWRDGKVEHDGPVEAPYFAGGEEEDVQQSEVPVESAEVEEEDIEPEDEVKEAIEEIVEQTVEVAIQDEIEADGDDESVSYEPPEPETKSEPSKEELKGEISALLARLQELTRELEEVRKR